QTSAEHGGILINYMRVGGLLKDSHGRINGVKAVDLEHGKEYVLNAKAVINATGVFVDDVLKMNSSAQEPMVRPSQGVHIVLDHSFLEGSTH
ncbi:MAG TPA: FAD-dependent oxidoreductase, partial [Chryseosolibacter sp.]|nr:FAD-dependent oxidoreductase [Chryseosolibacter sp.]